MRRFTTIIVLFLAATSLFAEELTMNAAVAKETQRVSPDVYDTIVLVNTLPSANYTIQARVEAHEIPPIDLAAAQTKAKEALDAIMKTVPPGATFRLAQVCDDLTGAVDNLLAAKEEREVRDLVLALESVMAESGANKCPAMVLARAAIARTTWRFATNLPIEAGQFATVVAFRVEAGKDPVEVSQKIFDAGELGAVRTHLVAGALPNNDQRWFAKEAGEGKYLVTREDDRDAADPFGAVLFTWLPARNTSGWGQILSFKQGAVSGSFTVGIGLESSDPIYLAGYALNVTESFGLALGIAGYNQRRLKGIYKGDGKDEITENLQPDQLTDETFDRGVWVGITFRR